MKPKPIYIEVQPTTSLPDGRNLRSDGRVVVTVEYGDDEFVYVYEASEDEPEHDGTPGIAAHEAWDAFMSVLMWEERDKIRRENEDMGIFDDEK